MLVKMVDADIAISHLALLQTTALHCWKHCLFKERESPLYAPALPLVGLPHVNPKKILTLFKPWTEAGLETVGDCYL